MPAVKLLERYDIWFITYETYAAVAVSGDIKPKLVEANLTYEAGLVRVQELGFSYALKPSF